MKIRQGIAPAIVAIGLGIAVAPHMAEAHTAEAFATCAQGLTVDVVSYVNPTTTVVIDGSLVATFAGNVKHVYPMGSPSAAHTYVVTVREAGTDEYTYTKADTLPACVEPTTTTEAPTTTVAATTTTVTPPAGEVTTTTAVTTTPAPSTTTTEVGTVGGQSGTGAAPTATRPATASATGTLPATGSSSGAIAAIATAMVAAGGALWFAGRRTRRAAD